jgi:hypothetical protein
MDEGRCRICQRSFQPSKFKPHQAVCSGPECQRRRRSEYHKAKIASDPEYREVCRDSPRKWRVRNPDYWKGYREQNPASVEHNRNQQKARDRKRRLRHLANNTSAVDLKHSAAQVWLVGAEAMDLANNNSASAQVWVIQVLPTPRGVLPLSCKQQPSGSDAPSAA